jgi:hypothetical protein
LSSVGVTEHVLDLVDRASLGSEHRHRLLGVEFAADLERRDLRHGGEDVLIAHSIAEIVGAG